MRKPNPTFHQDQQTRTLMMSCRLPHPALGEPSDKDPTHHPHSHITLLPGQVSWKAAAPGPGGVDC